MDTVFSLLAGLFGLLSFILDIVIVVKMFQKAGVLQGIIGLICSLWAFIWGWMNAREEKLMNLPIMLTWTGCIVGAVICNVLAGVFAVSSSGG